MARFTIVLAIVASTLCASSFAILFDCRRDGQMCMGGALCSYEDGMCQCTGGRTGHDCMIENGATVPQAGCPGGGCQNGGTCYQNGGDASPRCFCSPVFSGARCETMRVRVDKCEFDYIEATIDPQGMFGGEMAFMYKNSVMDGSFHYVDSSTGMVNCSDDDRLNVTVFEQGGKVGVKAFTCVNRIDNLPTSEWLTAEFAVSVQYNKQIWGALDNSFLFRCMYFKQGNKTVGTAVELSPPTAQVITEETYVVPLMLYITESTNPFAMIAGPQYKGDSKMLTVEFNGKGVYKDFAVKECTAYSDENDFTTGAKLAIVVDKCYDRGAAAYFKRMTKETMDTGKQLIKMDFTLFKFKNADRVTFNCLISLCRSVNDPMCALRNCNGVDQFGRRRRETLEAVRPETLKTTITILDKRP